MTTPVSPPPPPEVKTDKEQTRSASAQPQPASGSFVGSGCRGFVWVLGGALGCLGVSAALIVGVLLVAGVSVTNFFDGFVGLFEPQETDYSVFVPVVERVTPLSDLTVMRYNYSNIVTSEIDMPQVLRLLYGDRLVMVAVGHIEAGISLNDISAEDVTVDEDAGTVTITLPPAKLRNCYLDESKTQIVSRETGVFTASPISLDLSARRFAIQQFRDIALEEGLIEQAQQEAERVLRAYLESVAIAAGFDEIPDFTFIHTPADPEEPYPETCL